MDEEQLSSALDEDVESSASLYDVSEDRLSSSFDEEQLSRDLDEKAAPYSAPPGSEARFVQPPGRPRKGHSWNAVVGIWVPDNASLMTKFFDRIPKTS